MNIRRLPITGDYFTGTTTEPAVVFESVGTGLTFQPVGRPWRYEFPHQPSTSDPSDQPLLTVPLPDPEPGSVLAQEFDATPPPEPLHAADPSDQPQKSG